MQKELFATDSLVGKILHASWGYNCTLNTFLLALQETKQTVVVKELARELASGDLTAGTERPLLDESSGGPQRVRRTPSKPFRLRKKTDENGNCYFLHREKVFSLWDGKDAYFNSD